MKTSGKSFRKLRNYNGDSMEVSIHKLKKLLSQCLRHVAEGKEVVITSQKRPIARLVPPLLEPSPVADMANIFERLKAMSWAQVGKGGKPKGARHPIKLRASDKLASDIVLDDRR